MGVLKQSFCAFCLSQLKELRCWKLVGCGGDTIWGSLKIPSNGCVLLNEFRLVFLKICTLVSVCQLRNNYRGHLSVPTALIRLWANGTCNNKIKMLQKSSQNIEYDKKQQSMPLLNVCCHNQHCFNAGTGSVCFLLNWLKDTWILLQECLQFENKIVSNAKMESIGSYIRQKIT